MSDTMKGMVNAPITRQEFRTYLKGVALSAAIVLGSVGYVMSTKPDTAALTAGLVSSCQRENITHAQANNTALVSFRVLSIAGRQNGLLHDEARDLRVTDLTNCKEAVQNARRYQYPMAVPIGNPETGEMYRSVRPIAEKTRILLLETADQQG